LIRGADKRITDSNGVDALELASEIESQSLKEEVIHALNYKSSLDCLMVNTPLRKSENSIFLSIAFLVIFDLLFALLMIFLFPFWI
jgi:hypothetical protein